MANNLIHITTIICTHNRSSILPYCLNSINIAKKPNKAIINILVVANACSDNTINVIERFKKENPTLSVNILLEKTKGKSFALNRAIKSIKEGFLCLIDDDQRVDSDYFVAVCDAIQYYPEKNIFCGPIYPDWQGDEPNFVHNQGKYKIYPPPIPTYNLGEEPLSMPDQCYELPGGGHTIVNSVVFRKVGLFSTSLGPQGHNLLGSEDTDFFQRALDCGESIQYIPAIKQFHYVDNFRLKKSYLIKKAFQRNRSITLHRTPLRTPPPPYLIRQFLTNIIKLIFSIKNDRRFFYLMRCSSILGEITGLLENSNND